MTATGPGARVVFPLHGIRTEARWRDAFNGVAQPRGWNVRLSHWYFGRYGALLLLISPARNKMLLWFRDTYDREMSNKALGLGNDDFPSVVAHSFGTYILGHALLRFPFLRFNKVILCGSILPRDFPWEALIESGQVQAVRNEYGARDTWSSIAPWFIRGSGASGIYGFDLPSSERFIQEGYRRYTHSDYFSDGHMLEFWMPFLERPLERNPPQGVAITQPKTTRPWALYGLGTALVVAGVAIGAYLGRSVPSIGESFPNSVPIRQASPSTGPRIQISTYKDETGRSAARITGSLGEQEEGRHMWFAAVSGDELFVLLNLSSSNPVDAPITPPPGVMPDKFVLLSVDDAKHATFESLRRGATPDAAMLWNAVRTDVTILQSVQVR